MLMIKEREEPACHVTIGKGICPPENAKMPKLVVSHTRYFIAAAMRTAMGPVRAFGASNAIYTTFTLAFSIRSRGGIATRQAPRRCSMQLLISSAECATKRRRAQHPATSLSKARQKVPGFLCNMEIERTHHGGGGVCTCTHDRKVQNRRRLRYPRQIS